MSDGYFTINLEKDRGLVHVIAQGDIDMVLAVAKVTEE